MCSGWSSPTGLFLGALILVGDSLGESFGRRLMRVLGVANLLSLS